jgi:hypothetical protein
MVQAWVGKTKSNRERTVDSGQRSDELGRLEERAAKGGMTLAAGRIDGYWRAGFVVTNDLGESIFVLHASGPDECTAVRGLAKLAADMD